jgi:arginase
MRSLGVNRVALRTLEKMESSGVEGFWVTLDADVLDDAIMPAVDSRQPDGLSYTEIHPNLRAAVRRLWHRITLWKAMHYSRSHWPSLM